MGTWIVQPFDPATPWTGHDNETEADRVAAGHKLAVVWFCANLQPDVIEENVA